MNYCNNSTCFPVDGNHEIQVAYIEIGKFPSFSPSAPHLHTSLSSLTVNNVESGDHAAAVTISVSIILT